MPTVIAVMKVIFIVFSSVCVIPQTLRALIFAHTRQTLPSANQSPQMQRATGSVI
jgi:hypothetical protein